MNKSRIKDLVILICNIVMTIASVFSAVKAYESKLECNKQKVFWESKIMEMKNAKP